MCAIFRRKTLLFPLRNAANTWRSRKPRARACGTWQRSPRPASRMCICCPCLILRACPSRAASRPTSPPWALRPTAAASKLGCALARPKIASTGATTRCTTARPRAATPPTRKTAACAFASSAPWWRPCTARGCGWAWTWSTTTPRRPASRRNRCSIASCRATTTASTPRARLNAQPAATTPPPKTA